MANEFYPQQNNEEGFYWAGFICGYPPARGGDNSSGSALEIAKVADLKSAGHSTVQVLYNWSPECSKTPQNALLQPISHNNIRKTGSIRNRRVSCSSPKAAALFQKRTDQFSAAYCATAVLLIFPSGAKVRLVSPKLQQSLLVTRE